MIEEYKKSMNKIKADDELKARILQRVRAESEKLESTPKVVKSKHPRISYPLIAGLASAAVLVLTIFASKSVILPMLSRDSFDSATGTPNTDEVTLTKPTPEIEDFNAPATPKPEVDKQPQQPTIQQPKPQPKPDTTIEKPQGVPATPETSHTPVTEEKPTEQQPSVTKPEPVAKDETYSGATAMNDVDYSKKYEAVSYSSNAGTTPKSSSSIPATVQYSYDTVLHFTFHGFEEYGIGLTRNDVIFCAELDNMFTIEDLFRNYYNVIIARDGEGLTITDGIVTEFFGVTATDGKRIDVFVDGIDIVDLTDTPLQNYKDMEDVYFTVSITQ